jgi:indolepyruvate ferredoxin oxidoreductase
VVDLVAPQILSNAADAVKRTPYFCSGCPHNTSTKVPEGSRALAGIGCHFMASWMERDTTGLIQMGGEGVDWASHSMFTKTRTSSRTSATAPISTRASGDPPGGRGQGQHHLQDPLQRRGRDDRRPAGRRQHLGAANRASGRSGRVSRRAGRRERRPEKYDGHHDLFPKGTTFHHRSELDAVQRVLRDIDGVTVLIYDQTCAAEKRRRRKKRNFPIPTSALHQRSRVRRLWRLRCAIELPVGRAG